MTAKEYLRQVELLDVSIKQKQMQVEELRILATNLSSTKTGEEKVQSSLSGDTLSENVSYYLDLQNEINADISKFIGRKNKIINQIQELDDVRYIQILFEKYIEYKSLKTIAVKMCYNYNRIKHLHGYALQTFEEKYLKDSTQ